MQQLFSTVAKITSYCVGIPDYIQTYSNVWVQIPSQTIIEESANQLYFACGYLSSLSLSGELESQPYYLEHQPSSLLISHKLAWTNKRLVMC